MKKILIITSILILTLFIGCSDKKSNNLQHQNGTITTIGKNDSTYSQIKQSTAGTFTDINNTSQTQQTTNQDNEIKKDEINTPVVINNFFIGGLIKGKWKDCEEFYNSKIVNMDGFIYDDYSKDKKVGTSRGEMPSDWKTGELLKGNTYSWSYNYVELYDTNNESTNESTSESTNECFVSLKATWNLFPRKYINQNTNQKTYYDIVGKILKDEGIANPDVKIKQIIRTDLDGDDSEEVLINANNASDDGFKEVKKGDYAITILRKIVNGKVENQIINISIKTEDPETPSIYRLLFNIGMVADLDGDGMMEVIIKNWYYEGEGWSVYKLNNNKLELIAENGLGA